MQALRIDENEIQFQWDALSKRLQTLSLSLAKGPFAEEMKEMKEMEELKPTLDAVHDHIMRAYYRRFAKRVERGGHQNDLLLFICPV